MAGYGQAITDRYRERLRELAALGRDRQCRLPVGVDLTSNDYLGLRRHPALRAAAVAALEGGLELGAGGSRLLRGHHAAHEELEAFAAAYFGAPAALYFATGFQANAALFATLPDRRDVILFDAMIHASARVGIQAAAARHVRVAHNDLNAFEDALREWRDRAEQIWIAVESVYSMGGDLAPLPELVALAQKYDATLVVDEAHATGVFGADGKGLAEGLSYDRLIVLHTCGKALGVAGGLICAAPEIVAYLVNRARGFIYSTAPMPLQAVLVQKALELAAAEPERRRKLWELRDLANQLLPVPPSASQIIPIIVGSDAAAVMLAGQLQQAGFDIRAIRPPTVPEGTARLRLSLSCELTPQEIHAFAAALRDFLPEQAGSFMFV